jgi:hypothetical protein
MTTTLPTGTAARATAEPGPMVRRETLANVLATVSIAAAIAWLAFRGAGPYPSLAPPPGGIFGILPGTFNFVLLVTLALTLVVRGRVARGAVRRAAPDEGVRRGARLPRNALLRALALAAATTLLFVPATYALVWLATSAGLLPPAWSFAGMLAFFEAYFVAVALFVTPAIVWQALRD